MTPADHRTARSLRPGLWDVVAGLVAVAVGVRVLSDAGGDGGFEAAGAVAYALTALGCATVAWGRLQPLAALFATGLTATVLAAGDYHVDVQPFVVTGLLFMVASYTSRRTAVMGLAVTGAFVAVSGATRPADLGTAALVQTTLIFLLAWSTGRLVRSRRLALMALVDEAEHRADVQRRLTAAERDRSTLSLVEERLRIARDVHDVLAHSMSVVSVQATVGAHLAAKDPAAARQALLTISDVSRSSMQDLRQMLALLRDETEPGSSSDVSYEPAHGLAALGPLLDTYRSAGLQVLLSTEGAPRTLSATADLAAFRLVQEALTNTLKHAAATSAVVATHYREQDLVIAVTDDGTALGTAAGGQGLLGMRERVALVGGHLQTGHVPGEGFAVTATIPYEDQHRTAG